MSIYMRRYSATGCYHAIVETAIHGYGPFEEGFWFVTCDLSFDILYNILYNHRQPQWIESLSSAHPAWRETDIHRSVFVSPSPENSNPSLEYFIDYFDATPFAYGALYIYIYARNSSMLSGRIDHAYSFSTSMIYSTIGNKPQNNKRMKQYS